MSIPGPDGMAMLKGIRQMRRRPPEFLAECARRYGDVVAFPIPHSNVVFLADAQDVKQVLQTNHTAYGKRTIQYDALAAVTGPGLLASDGELWRRMRRTVQPAFHQPLIEGMAASIQQCVADWVGQQNLRFLGGRTVAAVDVDTQMLRLSLEVVGATLFSSDLRHEAASLVDSVAQALRIVVARSQQPAALPHWVTPVGNRRLTTSMAELDLAVDRLISGRRQRPLGTDALSLLLDAFDQGLATAEEVRNEVVTLIVAGHETVAATLTWCWSLLARHPQDYARLLAEVDSLPPPPWDADVLEQIPWCRAVVDECLRLYPPAWVITRRALADADIGGYQIVTGSTLIMSPYLLHRNAEHWPDPDQFLPDRFLDANVDQRRSSSYLPFGAGPRQCVGRDVSLFEAPLMLAGIARSLAFQLADAKDSDVAAGPKHSDAAVGAPPVEFGVTLRPRGGLLAHMSAR